MNRHPARGQPPICGRGRGHGQAPIEHPEPDIALPPPLVEDNAPVPQIAPREVVPPIYPDPGQPPPVVAQQVGSRANEMAQGERPPMTFVPMSVAGSITIFNGALNENVEEWLDHFEWIATAHSWGQELSCIQLPVYLGGAAKIWYETLQIEDRKEYNRLREKLVRSFQKIEVPVRRLQELVDRNQHLEERVSIYAYEKVKLCNQMDKKMLEKNKVIYFIQGLRRDLQTFVSLKEPKMLEDAIQLARKKEESLVDIDFGIKKGKVRNIESQDV